MSSIKIRKIKDPNTYIEMNNTYSNSITSDTIITVEHRSSNPKRDYLFVNKIQCKHIPCSPSRMIEMCKTLAKNVNNTLANITNIGDKVLVIGFAETATAIGTIVAENLCCDTYIMHTTREEVDGSKELIRFEEEHSHATTQKLLTFEDTNTNEFMKQFKYILFVEDEISTGNTILNFIDAFNKSGLNNGQLRFGVASICNWQSVEWKNKFRKLGIDRFSLLSGELKDTNAKMALNEKLQHDKTATPTSYTSIYDFQLDNTVFNQERLGYNTKSNEYISKDFDEIMTSIKALTREAETIRIIGTEEFMALPIKIGAILEELGKTVVCHATTRSKIDAITNVYDGEANGIKIRYEVVSAYDKDRKTYIYNTGEEVEMTLIISDTTDYKQFIDMLKSVTNTVINSSEHVIGIRL